MTPDIIAALEAASCPFCGASMTRCTDRDGEFWMHPGVVTDDDCFMSGQGVFPRQLAAWNRRAALSTSPTGQEVREVSLVQARRIVDAVTAYCRGADFSCDMKAATKAIRLMLNGLASPSVEPAGNGREAVENAFIAGWEAQKAGRSFAAAMNDHIPALSSPPAADQEAVKCKWCNDTGWTIGNGTVREGCLSCDAQINMVRATPPAPALDGVIPAEATDAMVEAGLTTGTRFGPQAMRNIWRTMYAAALSSPAGDATPSGRAQEPVGYQIRCLLPTGNHPWRYPTLPSELSCIKEFGTDEAGIPYAVRPLYAALPAQDQTKGDEA